MHYREGRRAVEVASRAEMGLLPSSEVGFIVCPSPKIDLRMWTSKEVRLQKKMTYVAVILKCLCP